MLADCTGVCQGVAWKDVIKVLEVDCTYKLRGVTVRSFNQAKYISLRERATIEEVDDIGEVVNEVVAA